MRQNYYRFPTTDIRNGGKIQGFVVEGVVSFCFPLHGCRPSAVMSWHITDIEIGQF